MVRRQKSTLFVDAKESTTVLELKKIIKGIMKKPIEEMKLYRDGQPIDDLKSLGDVGYTSSTARAQAPATIGLTFKQDDGTFEPLEITDLSTPPDLPEVMKPQESVSHTE
jgi:transcription elongation factor B subunit 2